MREGRSNPRRTHLAISPVETDRIRVTYNVPEGFDPLTAIAVGYAGDPSTLEGKMREMEESTRTRRAFDEFVTDDPARSRTTGGAGLGLAIARGIVDAHGGSIWADPGPGGRVTFSLPVGGSAIR